MITPLLKSLKSAFRLSAMIIAGKVLICAGDSKPADEDDGSIMVPSLYFRSNGEIWVKTDLPNTWGRIMIDLETV